MNPQAARSRVDIAQLSEYPKRIDARSPREYADDHVPHATNHPVLDDAERAAVGTLYVQSAFAARKVGAALVARNIAHMLETAFRDRERDWRPLVYCWRGGQRSRSLVHVLNEVGWRAVALDGGYRAYRRHVLERIAALPARFEFVVICGLTGTGKSRLLQALASAGAQTLDLERLARHRGSLLGEMPGAPQPSQKRFESALVDALEGLDPAAPVFVEAESRRIGRLDVPTTLLERVRAGRRIELVTSRALRVALLNDDYGHFRATANDIAARLAPLTPLHGKAAIERWTSLAAAGEWNVLVAELLERHYDPMYERSLRRHFAAPAAALTFMVDAIDTDTFAALASRVIASLELDARALQATR